jgi:hypothetical protein
MKLRSPSHWWLVAILAIGCGSDRVYAPGGAMTGGGGGAISDASDASVPMGDGPGPDLGGSGGGGSGGSAGAGNDARTDGGIRPDASIDGSVPCTLPGDCPPGYGCPPTGGVCKKYCIYDVDNYESDCVYAP